MAKQQPTKRYNWIKWFWILVVCFNLSIALVILLVNMEVFGKLPAFEELENPKSNLASVIYSADQRVIGKYFLENRTRARYNELSPHLVQALVATEDERFYDHAGIDFKGLMRAVAFAGGRGGASTITQQLAKLLFHERARGAVKRIIQKMQEWVIAVQLERQYTKEEIITLYFNKFDFINNAVGIKSATQVYFNKDPDQLLIQEAALLVGMVKNPSLFNPLRRPEKTQKRRNVVLYQMMRNEMISQAQFDSLRQLPITLDYKMVDHKEGLAPYFREVLRAEVTGLLKAKDPKTDQYLLTNNLGEPYNLYRDGLKIYTTIDSRLQAYAEGAVKEHLGGELQPDFFKDLNGRKNKSRNPFDWRITSKQVDQIMTRAMKNTDRYRSLKRAGKSQEEIRRVFETPTEMSVFSWQGPIDTVLSPFDSIRYHKSYLQTGVLSMDPHTGHVKAWVGGIDFKRFQYDHVRQGKRQVGSTFKPIVYALAMQEGYSPCHTIPNHQYCVEKGKWGVQKDWCPKNTSYSELSGDISLKFGLANSMNNVTAWVMRKFGPHAVIDMARKLGIQSSLDPVPSLCLGVADLSLMELVAANAVFANKGRWIEPTFITRIEDKHGNVIREFLPKSREALSEETAYVMLSLMKGVVDGVYHPDIEGDYKTQGTAIRIRGAKTEKRPYAGLKNPIAGKTGTTQNHSDGWFVGITPDLVTGVWVGGEDRSVRFRYLSKGMGTNMALPIWAYYMHQVYDDQEIEISKGDFEKPDAKLRVELNCDAYAREQGEGDDGHDYHDFNQ